MKGCSRLITSALLFTLHILLQQETLRAQQVMKAARDGPLDDYEMLEEATKAGTSYDNLSKPTTFRSNSYVEVVEKHMFPQRYKDATKLPPEPDHGEDTSSYNSIDEGDNKGFDTAL